VEDCCRNSVSIRNALKLEDNNDEPDDVEDVDSFLPELGGIGDDNDEDLNPELRFGNCILLPP